MTSITSTTPVTYASPSINESTAPAGSATPDYSELAELDLTDPMSAKDLAFLVEMDRIENDPEYAKEKLQEGLEVYNQLNSSVLMKLQTNIKA